MSLQRKIARRIASKIVRVPYTPTFCDVVYETKAGETLTESFEWFYGAGLTTSQPACRVVSVTLRAA